MIDEVPQYRAIVAHAPASIRAALSLQVAGFFTCRNLYIALCAKTCYKCGNFGAFLYVPTCFRVCFGCFTESKGFLPMNKAHAKVFWAITSRDIEAANMGTAVSLPGFACSNPIRSAQRIRL